MKKFKFKLEKVASIKAKQLKQRTHELARLMRQLETEKVNLQNLKMDLDAVQREIFKHTIEGCSVNELLEHHRYAEKLLQDITIQKKKIESIEENIEKMQVLLLKLNKEKKILEKLREKRYVQYIQEQNHEEQKVLDEMFTLTHKFQQIV